MTPPAPHGHAEAEARVAVIGAGPQGLAAALHLLGRDPSLHRDLVIFDPAGRWLQAWDDRFARLDIEHLRSPGVHHPGGDPYALGIGPAAGNLWGARVGAARITLAICGHEPEGTLSGAATW